MLKMMTDYEFYSLWISLGGVIATFAAVVVAIWGEPIRQYFTQPRLTLMLDKPSLTKRNDGISGWFYLLCVNNNRQSSPANNVRILLAHVFKKGPDGSWQEQRFSGPTQVMWRWPRDMPIYATIGPEERATFGYVLANANTFEFQLYHRPNNLKGSIAADDPTRLEFVAVSDTVQSKPIVVEIAWDGIWDACEVEMQKHLVLKQIAE